MGNADNVVVGVGEVWVSAVGSALPAQSGGTFDFAGVAGNHWSKVGYTKDGVEFGYAQEVFEGKVDQKLNPVVRLLMGEKVTIKTKLAETTIANIQKAIPASVTMVSPPTGFAGISLGLGELTEIQVAFCGTGGKWADGTVFQRVFVLYKATSDAPVTIAHKANDMTVLDVTWTALAVGTKELGDRLGCILEADEHLT